MIKFRHILSLFIKDGIYIVPSLLLIASNNLYRLFSDSTPIEEGYMPTFADAVYFLMSSFAILITHIFLYKMYMNIRKRCFSIPVRCYLLFFVLFNLSSLGVDCFKYLNLLNYGRLVDLLYIEWGLYSFIFVYLLGNIKSWEFDKIISDSPSTGVYLIMRKPSVFSLLETLYGFFRRVSVVGYKYYSEGDTYGFHSKESYLNRKKVPLSFSKDKK